MNKREAAEFLEDIAKYFENLPTNGEDRAHWAHVYNALNCRKIIMLLQGKRDHPHSIKRRVWVALNKHGHTAWNGIPNLVNIYLIRDIPEMKDLPPDKIANAAWQLVKDGWLKKYPLPNVFELNYFGTPIDKPNEVCNTDQPQERKQENV